MATFKPIDEDKLNQGGGFTVLPPGQYDFEVTKAEDTKSKTSGNDMIKLTLAVFDKGKEGDYSAVRFQGTIRKFARECRTDASGTTTIKVGVAGRLLAGPNGATGAATLPIRVVLVRDGDEVLYSKLYPLNVTIAPGSAAADWDLVAPDVVVTGDKSQGNFVIYVGFDETKDEKKK